MMLTCKHLVIIVNVSHDGEAMCLIHIKQYQIHKQYQMENLWSVVYTYPQAERKIAAALVGKCIDTYLPLAKEVRQWSDRKKKVVVPIFPNYVFVHLRAADRYKVLSVPGVTRFISIGGHPVVIPEKEMNSIRMLTESDNILVKEEYYHVGDRVRVSSGPFVGLQGMLIEKNGSKRFYVRFDSIEQAVSIAVEAKLLEKIE